MPFEKGQSGNPNGRKKGTPNKTTKKTREFINDLLEGNQEKILEALEEVREKQPLEYIKLWQSMLEFGVPKLSRTELTGKDEEPLSITIKKTYKDEGNK